MKVAFALLAVVALIIASVHAEMVMYSSTITTNGIDKSTLNDTTEKMSSWVRTRCSSTNLGGLASRSGGTITALWLRDDTIPFCTSTDLRDFVAGQGIFGATTSNPVLAEKFQAKKCTEVDENTGFVYVKCGGCGVAGCSNAMTFGLALPVVAMIVLAFFF